MSMTHTFYIQIEFDYLFKHLTATINLVSFDIALGFAVVFSRVFLEVPFVGFYWWSA